MLFLGLTMPLGTMAQKGMQSIGANVPFDIRKNNKSLGFGIKYQYNFTDHFRMELAGSYSPFHNSTPYCEPDDSWEIEYAHVTWQGSINANFFLVSPRTIRPYFIVGAGVSGYETKRSCALPSPYSNQTYRLEEYEKLIPIDINAGIGVDLRIHYRWSLQLSALVVKPFMTTDDLNSTGFSRGEVNGQFNVGVTYNF